MAAGLARSPERISTSQRTISGVNMRLAAGAIRELHWHLASEWAIVTYGNCRITVLDPAGHAYVADLKVGDLWYFPAGYPHSLQGLGADGAEFILCFDDGNATEFNTLLVTDWIAHTPPEVLAENFGVPVETFQKIPLNDLYIFPSQIPGPLDEIRNAIRSEIGDPPNPFTYSVCTDRRQHQFQSRHDGRGGTGHGPSGWPARTPLASKRG